MNKLIFRKFSLDIANFFLISSFSITFIIWIIQAVNFLDLVSDDCLLYTSDAADE